MSQPQDTGVSTDAEQRRWLFYVEVAKDRLPLIHDLHVSVEILADLCIAGQSPALKNLVSQSEQQLATILKPPQMEELKVLLSSRGMYLGMSEEHMREAFGPRPVL